MQRDFTQVIARCKARGHRIDVYTLSWRGPSLPGVNIIIIPARGRSNHQRAANFGKDVLVKIAEKKYDTVIGFNKMPGLDIYYGADPCFRAHSLKNHSRFHQWLPRYRVYNQLEAAVFNKASKTQCLLLSEKERDLFAHYYHTPAHRMILLPPGIDKKFKPMDDYIEQRELFKKKYQLDKNQLILLFVASAFKTKGLDRILKALAGLPENLKNRYVLFIIGDDKPERYGRLIDKNNLSQQLRFMGPQDNLAPFYWGADLLVHPARLENTGTVLLEAMVAGLPVLTTSNCGYADYIKQSGGGWVLPAPFEQFAFNQVLTKRLLDQTGRERAKSAALNYSEQHDIYSLHQKAVELIEQGTVC